MVFDPSYDQSQIKFVKNDQVFELEGQDNRRVYFNEQQETKYEAVFDRPDVTDVN